MLLDGGLLDWDGGFRDCFWIAASASELQVFWMTSTANHPP